MRKILLLFAMFMGFSFLAFSQNRIISGSVLDETGKGIPFATIAEKGTSNGVSADTEGNFTITVRGERSVLVVSATGFIDQEVIPRSGERVVVTLRGTGNTIEEVVVTAVGIKRARASLTASSATISGADVAETRQTNLLNGLAAKAPGLQIQRSTGGVNTATRITMRGQRSFTNNDNQPLIVVDGVPTLNTNNQPSSSSSNQVDVGSRIGDINPDDIESVTVLYGPNAAALYGSKASNGALIITTKSGKLGKRKLEVTVNSSYSVNKVQKLPDLQNEFGSGYPDGEGGTIYDPIENTNWGPRLDGSMVQSGPTLADGSKNMIPFTAQPNNAKDFFNTGTDILNSISFNGGGENGGFYASLSDAESKGIIPMDKFRRTTAKISGQSKLTNNFTVSGNLQYNRNITNTSFQGGAGATGIVNAVLNVSRQIDLSKYKDWRNNPFATPDGFFDGYYPNPYYALANNRFLSNLDRFFGTVQASWDPASWINITYRLGTDISEDNRKQTFEKTTYGLTAIDPAQRPASTTGGITEDNLYYRIINSDLLISLKKDFNEDFSGNLVLLQNVYQSDFRSVTASASAIAIPGFFNLSNRIGELGGGETTTKQRQYGFAGDLTLDYKKFLYLNATLRNDVASTLNKENRSYWYPSVGLSYVLSKSIPSLNSSRVLSYAKLRAGYSKVGSNTGPYNLVPTYSLASGFPYGSLTSFTISRTTPTPDLKPEFTNSLEAGADLSFFGDRLGINFTYYHTESNNQIISIGIPPSTGYTSARVNAGELTNKGIEVGLTATPIKTNFGFSWNFGISYSHNSSIVGSLYQDSKQLPLGSGDPVPTAIVGMQFPVFLGTDFERDPQGRVVVDENGDPIQHPELHILGQINPKHILGFSNTFTYKNLSLTTIFDYRTGNKVYSGTASTMVFAGSTPLTTQYNREPFVFPNSVIETSEGVYEPNTSLKTSDGSFDFWYNIYNNVASTSMVDASFLKLRQASLEFAFPKRWLDKTPFGKASIGLFANNILLWVPKSNIFIDPEANIFGNNNSQGREIMNIPSAKNFGVNLLFTF